MTRCPVIALNYLKSSTVYQIELSRSSIRTSSSCPMLWPVLYDSRREEMRKRGLASALEELDLVSLLSARVADLLATT